MTILVHGKPEIAKAMFEKSIPTYYHCCKYCGCIFTWTENDLLCNRQELECPECKYINTNFSYFHKLKRK